MVQRDSGRFRQVRACRHAPVTNADHSRALLPLAGCAGWPSNAFAHSSAGWSLRLATGSILARCAHIRTACRDTQSPNALCAIWTRLAVVLALRPPSPIVGFLADCLKLSPLHFYPADLSRERERPRPLLWGSPPGGPPPGRWPGHPPRAYTFSDLKI